MFLNAKAPKKKARVEDDGEEEELNAMLDSVLNEAGGAAPANKPKVAAAAKGKKGKPTVAPKSVYKVRTEESYAVPPPPPIRVKIETDGGFEQFDTQMVPKSQIASDDKNSIVVDDYVNDSHATSFYGVPEEENIGVEQLEQNDWFKYQAEVANNSQADVDLVSSASQGNNAVMDEQGNRLFYWLDAHEMQNDPDSLYLFGKVWSEEQNKFVSACMIVKDHFFSLYAVPRPFALNENGEVTDEVCARGKEFLFFVFSNFSCPFFFSKGSYSWRGCKRVASGSQASRNHHLDEQALRAELLF